MQKLLVRGAQPLPLLDVDVIKKKRESRGFNKDDNIDIRWRLLSGKTADAESKLLLSKAVAIFHVSAHQSEVFCYHFVFVKLF